MLATTCRAPQDIDGSEGERVAVNTLQCRLNDYLAQPARIGESTANVVHVPPTVNEGVQRIGGPAASPQPHAEHSACACRAAQLPIQRTTFHFLPCSHSPTSPHPVSRCPPSILLFFHFFGIGTEGVCGQQLDCRPSSGLPYDNLAFASASETTTASSPFSLYPPAGWTESYALPTSHHWAISPHPLETLLGATGHWSLRKISLGVAASRR